MDVYVLDSSVVVKWFKPTNEKGAGKALNLFRLLEKGEIKVVVPDLLYYEIANVFVNLRDGVIDFWISSIDEIYSFPFEVVSPNIPLSKETLRLAEELELSAYDATYLVLARQFGARLVTEDRKLLEKGGELVVSLDRV